MIESLFKELLSAAGDDESARTEEAAESFAPDESEDLLLETVPVIHSIVRRKTLSSWQSDAADLVQGILLRLIKWRNNYFEKSSGMSSSEWKSFAARTAYNEINRHYASRTVLTDIPFDDAPEAVALNKVEGNTDGEVNSLARYIWQGICVLSLRQRRAILLHSQELIVCFLEVGITHEEIAGVLELSASEWANVRTRVPLPDFEIACLSMMKNGADKNLELATKSVKKARFEARMRLRRKLTKK